MRIRWPSADSANKNTEGFALTCVLMAKTERLADVRHGLRELLDSAGSGTHVVEVFAISPGGMDVELGLLQLRGQPGPK